MEHALAVSTIGSPASVEKALRRILEQTQADELILTGHVYDHKARLRSFEIGAEVWRRMAKEAAPNGATSSRAP